MKKVLLSVLVLLMVSGIRVQAQYVRFKTEPGDFKIMAEYIQKHGFVVKERGVPSDREVVFIDKDKNRFAFIASRRDDRSMPSLTAPIEKICVWAYKKGVRKQSHFFGGIFSGTEYASGSSGVDPGLQMAKEGYRQFLEKIKKQR